MIPTGTQGEITVVNLTVPVWAPWCVHWFRTVNGEKWSAGAGVSGYP